MKRIECHEAQVTLIHPSRLSKEEYNSSVILTDTTLENRVDAYFYHDLTRVVLETILDLKRKNSWPELDYPECDSSLSLEQINQRQNISLGQELASDGLYGRFGRFKFEEYATRPGNNYQDLTLKIDRISSFSDTPSTTEPGTTKPGTTEPCTTKGVGEWKLELGYMSKAYMEGDDLGGRPRPSLVSETKNMQGHMRVVIITQPPFIMKEIHPNGTVEYVGYCIDLLKEVQKKMANGTGGVKWNWTYTLEEIYDGRFGENKGNNTWTGIIGELATKRADIGLGPVAVMAERETVVDFTVPYYDLVGINILMKKPAVPSHLFKFLTVLDNKVWASVFIAYILVSFLIWIYDRYVSTDGFFLGLVFEPFLNLENFVSSQNQPVQLPQQEGRMGRLETERFQSEGVTVVLHDEFDSTRRWRSTSELLRPDRCRHLVDIRIHCNRCLHGQPRRLLDCFPSGFSHRILGPPF